MFKKLNNKQNGYTKENELLIALNSDLLKYVVSNDENNLYKVVDWLNKANETGNKYGFVVFNVILDLSNENDFNTFKNLCIKSVSDLEAFKLHNSDINLNKAFVFVFENSCEYFIFNKNNVVQFIVDYVLYSYYNDFLYDLFVFLSSLI